MRSYWTFDVPLLFMKKIMAKNKRGIKEITIRDLLSLSTHNKVVVVLEGQ